MLNGNRMEKYYTPLIFFLLLLSINNPVCSTPLLVIDGAGTDELPPHFRIIDEPGLRMIGSGQFTPSQLRKIHKKLNHAPIAVIDLRQESHGFADETPVSWYAPKNWINKDKSSAMIQTEESNLLEALSKHSEKTVHRILRRNAEDHIEITQPIRLKPRVTYSEAALAQTLGLKYKRFYVTDHSPPNETQIEALKQFTQSLPENTWVYFHCRAGIGRTSAFMTLYAIMQQGHAQPFQTIMDTQIKAGGKNLEKMPHPSSYKHHLAKKRLQVIQEYYESTQKTPPKGL